MEVTSARLGTLEVDEQFIYTFTQGLYGLEEYRTYALIRPDETLPFAYLQAVEQPEICLLLADPFAFYKEYEFDLPEEDVQALQQPAPTSLSVWVTVSAKDSLQEATINLMAPIILNTEKKLGRQVVLHDSPYETRTPLFQRQKEGA